MESSTASENNHFAFSSLAESVFDAVFIFQNGKCVHQNQLASALFGYTDSEAKDQPFSFWFNQEDYFHLSSNFHKGITVPVTSFGRQKDGNLIPSMLRLRIIQSGENPLEMLACTDISGFQQPESDHKHYEYELQEMYNSIPVMMHSITKNGEIEYVSDYWVQKMGYTREEVIGRPVTDLFTEASKKYALEVVLPNFTMKGVSKNIAYEWIKKDGRTFSSLLNAVALKDSKGNFIRSLAVTVDITDLKKAEGQLTALYEQQQALIEAIPDMIIFKDGSGKWLITNEPAKKMFNLYDQDWVGKTSQELLSNTDEIVRDAFANANEEDDITWQSGKLCFFNKTIPDITGKLHYYELRKVPLFEADGSRKGIITIASEITERKEEETRLQLLETAIANATDAITISELDLQDLMQSKVIYANKSSLEMSGYGLEDYIGKAPRFLRDKANDPLFLNYINDLVVKGEAFKTEKLEYRKNGEAYWSNFTITPVSIKSSEYTHWIGIKRDTTDQKEMELELIKAKEKAEAGSKAKSEFLANMSHEIRTPLNSVIGFSDLLLKSQLNYRQQEYVSAVSQSANALIDIINGILDFSKIEAGKLEIDLEKTDLMEMAEHVVYLISIQSGKKNLETLLDISPDVPKFIWADAIRLRQVLINLLGNAVKFTKEGEIELKIELLKDGDNEENIVRFAVRDTGVGIDPANQKKIFEAFTQEDSSTNKRFGGTGLGLTISKSIIELMGSSLQLKSEIGKGSTFFFDLSVHPVYGASAEWVSINNCKKVLIVDDNINNRKILKDMLVFKNIDSDEAVSGMEAIQLLKAGNMYDVILVDFNMPGLDGIATVRHIRQDTALQAVTQPFILLHSSAEDEEIHNGCKELGIKQHLVKPIKMKQLFDALSKINFAENGNSEQRLDPDDNNKITARYDSCKVLVVDDNAFNMLLIKTVIGEILPNAYITEAGDGKEAVEKYTLEGADIVFMDVQMPEMNGYDATRAIRALSRQPQTPIIAITAGTMKEERDKCLEAGMNDYVSKPYVISSVMDVVNRWLFK